MKYLRNSVLLLPLLIQGIFFGAASCLAFDSPPDWTEAQKPIVELAKKFETVFNSNDPEKLESFFAEDARLITVDGVILEGRDAILELLSAGIESNPGIQQTNDIRSIRLVGDSVAIEKGFTTTTTTADKTPNTVAYYMVYVKRGGQWKIFDVMETSPVQEERTTDHVEKLAGLDFLVGHWVEEAETATIHHHVKWSQNHRYLLIEYVAETGTGEPQTMSTQRIGWDPRSKSIVSWLFEEDGGHGTASWAELESGHSWLIKGEAVLEDGRTVTSSMKLNRLSDQSVQILNYDRTAEGKAIPDAKARTLNRKPPVPSAGTK